MLNPFASRSINKFHTGIYYTEYLKQIHRVVKTSSYLEIGVHTGVTLGFAECRAVDQSELSFSLRSDRQADRNLPVSIELTRFSRSTISKTSLRRRRSRLSRRHAQMDVTLDSYGFEKI